MPLSITAISLITALSLFFFYSWIWLKFKAKLTPKGAGVFLPLFLFLFGSYCEVSLIVLINIFLIFIFTLIYWLDDMFELNSVIRLLVSFISGILFTITQYYPVYEKNSFFAGIVISGIFFGIMNMILTNVANFYDGEDLNITLFILLAFIALLLFGPIKNDWYSIIYLCLLFMLAFSILNARPNFIYFGDSGSFAFSCIFVSILISIFNDGKKIPIEVILPFLLPLIDVFIVILFRIIKRENLLSRNYFHIYQRLKGKYGGKYYLLPQIANVFFCYIAIFLLNQYGIVNTNILLSSAVFITFIFYWALHAFFLNYRFNNN